MSQQAAVALPVPTQREQEGGKPRRQPRYHVVLWNDEDHSYAYVMAMMAEVFGYPLEKGYQIACEVDKSGRAVVLTTTKEHAELKRDQIHAYGKDAWVRTSKGSMSASIEAEQ